MKKIAGRAAAMAMAVVMMSGASGMGVLAADTKSESKDTQITYKRDAEYNWQVPANFNFSGNVENHKISYIGAEGSNEVKITQNVIEANYTVNVTVKGDGTSGEFTIKDEDSNDTLQYDIYKIGESESETKVKSGDTVLTVEAGKTGKQALKFVLDLTENEKAGNYSGKATFTATATKTNTQ